jgi:hypothetical protein
MYAVIAESPFSFLSFLHGCDFDVFFGVEEVEQHDFQIRVSPQQLVPFRTSRVGS